MRNDDVAPLVLGKKLGKVRHPCPIEIVGGLVEQEEVGGLDERRGQEEARLLAAREGADSALMRRGQDESNRLEHSVNPGVNIVDRVVEALRKEGTNSQFHLLARNNLGRGRDLEPMCREHAPALWGKAPRHECENSRLARAVLAHNCELHPPPYGEADLIKNGFGMAVFEGHAFKAYDALFSRHRWLRARATFNCLDESVELEVEHIKLAREVVARRGARTTRDTMNSARGSLILFKTVAAVDWLLAVRLEGHLADGTTLRTGSLEAFGWMSGCAPRGLVGAPGAWARVLQIRHNRLIISQAIQNATLVRQVPASVRPGDEGEDLLATPQVAPIDRAVPTTVAAHLPAPLRTLRHIYVARA